MRSQVIVSWGAAQRFTFDLDEVQPTVSYTHLTLPTNREV